MKVVLHLNPEKIIHKRLITNQTCQKTKDRHRGHLDETITMIKIHEKWFVFIGGYLIEAERRIYASVN